MIITFYSYKPEVGCTMAAVNVGILLCQHFSRKTLLVDWNVTDPKLVPALHEFSGSTTVGLQDLLTEYMQLIDGDTAITSEGLAQCVSRVNSTSIPGLDYLPLSAGNPFAANGIFWFDWVNFYESYQGGLFVEYLRSQWEKAYDAVLIISERGLSRTASICTIQLPDVIVILIDMNKNRIVRSGYVIQRVFEKKTDGRQVMILPVLSKWQRVEMDIIENAKEAIRDALSGYLPPGIDSIDFLDQTMIPYLPHLEYEPEIVVQTDSDNGLASILLPAYMHITQHLCNLMQ